MLALNFTPFPELITERLLLRQLNLQDANELFLMRSDERVMQYLDRPRLQSVEEATAFLEKVMAQEVKNEAVTWVITMKGDTRMIGNICYWQIEKEHYRAEVGYMMHAAYHGKGIMNEALAKVLEYGFNLMKLHSVQANVNPGNMASIKLLERNGFAREAYFKENYFYDGKFLDSAIYSLLTPLNESSARSGKQPAVVQQG
jgi:ribosomal-protein-alanine N-acetyltransferase